MGCYINTVDLTKEAFLAKFAKEKKKEWVETLVWDTVSTSGSFLVALVHNVAFTAAMVVYCKQELEYIQRTLPTETRPIQFYLIDHGWLWENSDLREYIKKDEYIESLKK